MIVFESVLSDVECKEIDENGILFIWKVKKTTKVVGYDIEMILVPFYSKLIEHEYNCKMYDMYVLINIEIDIYF